MTQNENKTSIHEPYFSENKEVTDSDTPVEVVYDSSLEDMVAHITELEGQMAALRNDYLRALADAQNAQARADRRIEQNTKYAIATFVKDLVMVADNLGRALQHVPSDARSSDDLLNSLATGVEMTGKSLLTLMERHGLRRLDSLNQPFDPNLHQAVQEIENQMIPSGTVVQVLQEGYVLHDRLVRPAMVVVSRGDSKRQASPPQEIPVSQDTGALDSDPRRYEELGEYLSVIPGDS